MCLFVVVGDSKPVSVMIQHDKAEFMLCTLQQKKLYQQALDLNFTEGEEITFFLNGDGKLKLNYDSEIWSDIWYACSIVYHHEHKFKLFIEIWHIISNWRNISFTFCHNLSLGIFSFDMVKFIHHTFEVIFNSRFICYIMYIYIS